MIREELKTIHGTKTEVRKFGLTIGSVLLLLAAFLFWKQRPSFLYFAYGGGGFMLLGLIAPALLKPVFKAWMSFAVVMGFFMTRVILAVLYFGLFTPIALLAKMLGKDLLEERWDKNADTYWVKRPTATYNPQSAEQMF